MYVCVVNADVGDYESLIVSATVCGCVRHANRAREIYLQGVGRILKEGPGRESSQSVLQRGSLWGLWSLR